jgi:hypothetical protein
MMHETISKSFNGDFQDGSVEQVTASHDVIMLSSNLT